MRVESHLRLYGHFKITVPYAWLSMLHLCVNCYSLPLLIIVYLILKMLDHWKVFYHSLILRSSNIDACFKSNLKLNVAVVLVICTSLGLCGCH